MPNPSPPTLVPLPQPSRHPVAPPLGVLAFALALTLWAGACGRALPDPPTFEDRQVFTADPVVGELIGQRLAAVEAEPGAVEAWRGLGLVFEANGFARQAVAAYGHAAALAPDDGRACYHLAVCLEQLGDLEGAVEQFTKAAALGARHPPIYWRQGYAELALGRLEAAEASFRRALELEGGMAPPARVGLARVALARQDADAAIAELEPLLANTDCPTIAHHLMASALRLAGRADEVGPHLERAGDGSAPEWPDPWQEAVDALRQGFAQRMRDGEQALAEGRVADALGIYRQLAAERPDDPLPTTNLAAALIASGRSAEAIELLGPLDVEGASERFNVVMNLAAAHFMMGDLVGAKPYAERARALDAGKARPPEMLGAILLAEGRGEPALELLQEAVRLEPGNGLTLYRLARGYEQLGHWQQAADHYRHLLGSTGGRGDLRLRLARCLLELGERDEATGLLEGLRREGVPDNARPELEALLARLAV